MVRALVGFMLVVAASMASAEVLFEYGFEQGPELKAYEGLSFGKDTEAAVIERDGGHCLQVRNHKPSAYCQASIKRPMSMRKNLLLSFDHREEIEQGKKPAYLGILFFDKDDKQWFGSDEFSGTWRHCEIVVADMGSPNQGVLTLGKALERLNLYGRADRSNDAIMTVWLDNIRLETRAMEPKLSDKQRISYSNPPFFGWQRNDGEAQLEYSQDQTFPAANTTRVTVRRNFYMPEAPLAPGVWYWRVYRQSELADSYTPVQRITILPESHRFVTPPIPFAELAKRSHPRLIAATEAAAKDKPDLVRRAEGLARQGVPDDPPGYEPGNPNWPTWIDWYGKVHGGITSATGRRLQQMAELYVQTRDPKVRDLLKAMVFKAATWDPKGGSEMRKGDIGAQHFLRGLNWCYDALYDDLTEAERKQLRDVIVARAEQFWTSLNPFSTGGREYNNHAWLCSFALAESGLLLTGEVPVAEDWAEYVRELYLGLFLCGLGWQGDNNEGIAYWGYGLSFVIDYADMMKHVCGIDLFQHPWLYQTARFPMYSAPPGAWAVSFADTAKPNHSVRGPAYTSQIRQLALRTKDPYPLWYSGGTFAEAGVDPRPPVDIPQSIHYRFIGWAMHNTSLVDGGEGVTFAMRSGPFWAGHQHEDQNAFVIHAYGEKLAIDSGYYDWFGSPHFTNYSVLTRAHNAILVNGKDQDSRKPGRDGQIKAFFDSPGYGYTVGDGSDPDMYEGMLKQWDRRALFIKPGFVIIHDVLGAAQEPAQYDWLLHAVAPIETDASKQAFGLTSGKARLSGRFVAPADLKLRVVKGYPVEPVDGYSTRPVPPEQYSHEWTLWATPREKRAEEDYLVGMQIQRVEGAEDATIAAIPATRALGVECKAANQRHLALFRKRNQTGPISGGGIETDGETATVTLNRDGSLVRALMIGGTYLKRGGKEIIGSSQRGNVSLTANVAGLIVNTDLPQAGTVRIAAKKSYKLQAPAGEKQVVLEQKMPVGQSRKVKCGEYEFEAYALPVGEGLQQYWWGNVEIREGDRYKVSVADATGKVRAVLDNKPLSLTGGKLREAKAWLAPGRHLLLLAGLQGEPRIELSREQVALTEAETLPKDYKLGANCVIVEAEKPAAEGEIKGKAMEKVGASKGVAHCVWDTPGQWAEWALTLPHEGDYRILVRGCSEQSEVKRLVEIVGTKGFAVRMSGTGGWARTTDDWRYFAVGTVHLTPGEYRLRMEALEGSMNLDQVGLEEQR